MRAWTGISIAIPLVRHLGPRSTIHILRSLGELSKQGNRRPVGQAKHRMIGRGQFFKLVSAGITLVAGVILSGRAPALAEPEWSKARRWVETNGDRLPDSYDDLIAFPVEYRKAIFSAQNPSVRSRLWVEHLTRYRSTHPNLSKEQRELIDQALTIVSVESIFALRQDWRNGTQQQLRNLEDSALTIFGPDESYALIGTLGPSERPDSLLPGCTCYIYNNWCNNNTVCSEAYNQCYPTTGSGCGAAWAFPCNGLCHNVG
ncbi:MAG: bacteriocin fulvocin C-related protein [Pseudonocardiales bacterium]|nr:bacteriocin fulvocin C-related protein [Pseudonocardiales bacterium]